MDKIYVDLDNDQLNFEEEFKPFLDEEVKDPSIQTKPVWREEDISPYDLMEADGEEATMDSVNDEQNETAVWHEQDRSPYDLIDHEEDTFDKVKERIKEYGDQHVWKEDDQSPYDLFDDSLCANFDDPYDEMVSEDEFCKDCSNYDTCTKRQPTPVKKSQMQQMDDEIEANISQSEANFTNVQSDSDEYDCIHEADMYDNGNIDWQCGIDVSNNSGQRSLNKAIHESGSPKSVTYEKKTMVEENDPPKKTTCWIRVIKEY